MAPKHPDVLVRLHGPGDDFRIIGQVTNAMRRFGIPQEEIEKFCDEAMSGHDDDLLRLCGGGSRWGDPPTDRHWSHRQSAARICARH
jgi:hypothetical protein